MKQGNRIMPDDDLMAAMRQMIDGFCISRIIYIAAELGLADLLSYAKKAGPLVIY
jgi:hypothetical protein